MKDAIQFEIHHSHTSGSSVWLPLQVPDSDKPRCKVGRALLEGGNKFLCQSQVMVITAKVPRERVEGEGLGERWSHVFSIILLLDWWVRAGEAPVEAEV